MTLKSYLQWWDPIQFHHGPGSHLNHWWLKLDGSQCFPPDQTGAIFFESDWLIESGLGGTDVVTFLWQEVTWNMGFPKGSWICKTQDAWDIGEASFTLWKIQQIHTFFLSAENGHSINVCSMCLYLSIWLIDNQSNLYQAIKDNLGSMWGNKQ